MLRKSGIREDTGNCLQVLSKRPKDETIIEEELTWVKRLNFTIEWDSFYLYCIDNNGTTVGTVAQLIAPLCC